MTSKRVVTMAVAGVVAVGGAAFAAGCGANAAPAPKTASNTAAPVEQVDPQNGLEANQSAATGTADEAKKVALDRTGGGEVMSVETDEDGWDVDIIKGGSEYSIELDGSMNVVGEESEQLEMVEGAEGDQAKKAALDAAGGGELISLELDDNGGYEANIIKGDQEISIELDSSFKVVGQESETLTR